jgi:hypothetical protein
MLVQDFNRMMSHFAAAYPSSMQNGRLPSSTEQSYFSVLGQVAPPDLAEAFEMLLREERAFLPSAGIVYSTAQGVKRRRVAAYRTPNVVGAQLPAYGDGLPSSSRSIPIDATRKAADYTDKTHANTDHFLDIIRAMKLSRQGGPNIARRIMDELLKRPIGAPRQKAADFDRMALPEGGKKANHGHKTEQKLQGDTQCASISPPPTSNHPPDPTLRGMGL